MKSDDWLPMEAAPLNPYGRPWGPTVLIWDDATGTPVAASYDPWFGWPDDDCGPAWVLCDGDGTDAIKPQNAMAWMPIAVPRSEADKPNLLQYPQPVVARVAQTVLAPPRGRTLPEMWAELDEGVDLFRADLDDPGARIMTEDF